MTQKYPKRLIEVDLPIKRISAHARREKSIRHGHISTLHIWWARRPLAACRAVICASLWPDPADPLCPQSFRDRASKIIYDFASAAAHSKELGESCDHETWIKWQAMARNAALDSHNEAHWNILRFALLDFIADFANWDNSTVKEYLDTSRALTQAAHEALGGEPGTRPLVVDPFAGGGSIPLEALRVGADAFASDLNPVAVLLNKVILEYIPKYGQRLADEVRKWGEWIKQRGRERACPISIQRTRMARRPLRIFGRGRFNAKDLDAARRCPSYERLGSRKESLAQSRSRSSLTRQQIVPSFASSKNNLGAGSTRRVEQEGFRLRTSMEQ